MKIAHAPSGGVASVGVAITVGIHTARLWRSGQLRFRLETFGIYYPAPPYSRRAWQISPRHFVMLLRATRTYAAWLVELDQIETWGGHGWWETRVKTWEGIDND